MRRALALGALALSLSGCAYSMVQGGKLREEPFEDLVTRTAAARGDPRPERVDARVVSPAEVPPLLRESLGHHWSEEEMARYQERLVAVGLWPPDRDLVDETLRVAEEEIAGFYLPETRVLYAVDGARVPFSVRFASALLRRDLLREWTFAHELVHLLQHREAPALFDVAAWSHQDDAASAVQAAIEGDATHYGYLALLPPGRSDLLPDPLEQQVRMESEIAARREGALADAPGALRFTFAFPYTYGYPLSVAERRALFDDPPASTEQVLHPSRRRADFVVADLAALEARLPAGCESVGQNTLGELYLAALLRDHGEETLARTAAAGWDGDRYVAARCAGRRAFFWWTAWDSEDDAAEFEHAYAAVAASVAARAGLAETPRLLRTGRTVIVYGDVLAPLLPRLDDEARMARVQTLDALRAHFADEALR